MDTEPRRTISEDTWKQLATRLDVELAALKAVAEVESSGSGFLPAPDQPDGSRRAEPSFDPAIAGRMIADIAELPLEATVDQLTLTASGMKFPGRG